MQSEFKVYSASAGSGKTFTLVKEYLKIVLLNHDDRAFRSILAITFTNKAAGEMKDRVLKALEEFSKVDLSKKWPPLFQLLHDELKNIAPAQLKQKSQRVLLQIMKNYGAFSITTIDSFTHRLIRSFAFDLGIPLNFEIEMDPNALISEAVDLLLDQLGENHEITEALNRFIRSKIDQDKDWNIARDLNEVAQILINEVDMKEFRRYKEKSLEDFKSLEAGMKKEQKRIKSFIESPAKKALDLIHSNSISPESFSRSTIYNWLLKAADLENNLDKFDVAQKTVLGFMEGVKPYPNKVQAEQKQRLDQISDELKELIREILDGGVDMLPKYKLYKNLNKELIPLAVLNQIAQILEELKTDSGIKFISEFNSIISDSIADQPAPFIYEKLGERYRYYFIDEMQDTSEMQWSNLIPLLHNALSSENAMLMLVGDGKQSIYRWRGGKAEQFISLSSYDSSSEFLIEKQVNNLGTNYRSYSKVVDFNNRLFTFLSSELKSTDYKNMYANQNNQEKTEKNGGYVYYKTFENEDKEQREQELLEDVLRIVEQRDKAYKLGDICILVRKSSEGAKVADYLTEQGYPIVSSETLRLINSKEVNFLVDCLYVFYNQEDVQARVRILNFLMPENTEDQDAYFASFDLKDFDGFVHGLNVNSYALEINRFESMSLYDGLEYLIRTFYLNKESNSYLQFFLDFVVEFQQRNFGGLGHFLDEWERKKEKLSIVSPDSDDAIQIMTIHKSKGLEFPIVISAFSSRIIVRNGSAIWGSMPKNDIFKSFPKLRIPVTGASEGLSEEVDLELQTYRQENELDNMNVMYVAFTRASEQLYVLMQKPHKPAEYDYSYMEKFLQSKDCPLKEAEGAYVCGEPMRPKGAQSKKKSLLSIQSKLISSPWEEHDIRVLQEGSRYWDSKQGQAIDFGNKVHQIMADIVSLSDKSYALEKAISTGMISMEEKDLIGHYMDEIFKHPALGDFYQPGLKVMNERTMIGKNGEILIPDRLVFNKDEVHILDYKTGSKDIKYLDQLDAYAYVLNQMGLTIGKKILIYAGEALDVEVY